MRFNKRLFNRIALTKNVIEQSGNKISFFNRSFNGQWNHTVPNALILLDIIYPPVNDGCLGIKKVIGVSSLMGNYVHLVTKEQ